MHKYVGACLDGLSIAVCVPICYNNTCKEHIEASEDSKIHTGHHVKSGSARSLVRRVRHTQYPRMLAYNQRKGNDMKYNLRAIMTQAWKIFRKAAVSFSEALHRAWISAKAAPVNAARIAAAKTAAGITEDAETWSGWRALGYEVIHGSKALFGCDLIYGSRGDGAVYKARFFGRSQVALIGNAE